MRSSLLVVFALSAAACGDANGSGGTDGAGVDVDGERDVAPDAVPDVDLADAPDTDPLDGSDPDARDAATDTGSGEDAPGDASTPDAEGDANSPDAAGDAETDADAEAATDTGQATPSFPELAGQVVIDADVAALAGELDRADRFGRSMAILGDLSGDGTLEIAVGTRSDDDGSVDAGAVWVVSITDEGAVTDAVKLSATRGGVGDDILRPDLAPLYFGYGTVGLGDVNGDGVPDLGVTAPLDEGGGSFYALLLNADGTVASKVHTPAVPGDAVARLGDIDGDGLIEYATSSTNEGGTGAVHIYAMQPDFTLVEQATWSPRTVDALTGVLAGDGFGGRSITTIGDLDGDGVDEIGVGSFQADGGMGALWVLFLDGMGGVRDATRIGDGDGGLDMHLGADDNFGHALTSIGDVDGDGVPDVLTGANRYDGDQGSLYLLLMRSDGTVRAWERWDATTHPELDIVDGERFGRSMATVGDLSGDGSMWVAIGGGARTTGTVRLLRLR